MLKLETVGKLINGGLRPTGFELRRTRTPSVVANLPQRNFQDCKVFATRYDFLQTMPKGAIVAEVGVANGDFSAKILEIAKPSKFFLVDAWAVERYSSGYDRVTSRFAGEIASGAISIHRGLSVDVLPTLPPKSFDWIYLDTSHMYDDTVLELPMCAALLKDGGRIAGHDFSTGDSHLGIPFGVIQATYEFCAREGWGFESISLDGDGYFSFCLKKMPAAGG